MSVKDIGAITKQPIEILYYGDPKGITKKDVEKQVDDYLEENSIKPNLCKYYSEAYSKDYCSFSFCCEEDCLLCKKDAELLEEIAELEQELREKESAILELEEKLGEEDW